VNRRPRAAHGQAPAAGISFTLHPGDVQCADRGDRMETLLGSCVAIILTDPRRTVGAMCHIVHAGDAVHGADASPAFACVALSSMFAQLVLRGISPALCEAYVYGGGNMFPQLYATSHVGEDNADWALQALAEEGIRVLAWDLGGSSYRRLAWTVGAGAPEVTATAI
jgi:chemotaxis protein CheD